MVSCIGSAASQSYSTLLVARHLQALASEGPLGPGPASIKGIISYHLVLHRYI